MNAVAKSPKIVFNGGSILNALKAQSISPEKFFGVKSEFHSKMEQKAQLLIIDHFNGSEVNFGFRNRNWS